MSGYDASRSSWLPYTRNGYVGLGVGRSHYLTSCGTSGLRCDDSSQAGHVYVGGLFNPYLGTEFGYLHMGNADRAGGTTRAQGINLSLVGRLPLTAGFSVFGKLGTTYGRTRVDGLPGTGVVGGKESGWGPSYGLGLSVDFSNNWSGVLEWQRHRFQFPGNDRDSVRSTSLGLKYHF